MLRSITAPQRLLTMWYQQDCGRIQCMQGQAMDATMGSPQVALWRLHGSAVRSMTGMLTAAACLQGDDAAARRVPQ